MKLLTERKYINVVFVIAFLVLASSNILVYIFIDDHLQNDRYRVTSRNVLQNSLKLETNIIQSESNKRAYLLSALPEFITEYQKSLAEFDSLSSALRNLPSDNPKKNLYLDSVNFYFRMSFVSSKELARMYKEIDTLHRLDPAKITARDAMYQKRILEFLGKIINAESELVDKSIDEAERTYRYIITNMVIGTIVSFLLFLTSFILLNRKMSQQIQSERALEESRNFFSTTLRSIGDGVIVTDQFGAVTFMNPVAEYLTKWKENQIKGVFIENFFTIISEETREKLFNPVIKAFEKRDYIGETNHTLLVNKDKEEIPIDTGAAPIQDESYNTIGAVLIFRDVSARRKAQKEILESQRFIQRIAESTPNIIYIFNPNGPVLSYTNGRVSDVLGFTYDEVKQTGKEFLAKQMHPEDLKKFNLMYKKYAHAKDGEVLENEYRLKNAKGEWRWLRSYEVVFTRNSDGAPTQILGSALDITEKKQLEEQIVKYSSHLEELVEKRTYELKSSNTRLREEIGERVKAEKNIVEAEEKFQRLVEYSIVGIYILQDNKFVYVNPKFESIFGYKDNELNGLGFNELLSAKDFDLTMHRIDKCLNKAVPNIQFTFEGKSKDGSKIILEITGSTMDYDGKPSMIGTLEDITESIKSQQAVVEQQEFLRKIIDTNPNFVFVKDWNGKFELVNEAVAKVYGTTVDKLVGKTDADFNSDNKQIEHFLNDDREVMSTMQQKLIPEEVVTNSVTGELSWYQTIKVPLVSSDGNKQVLGISANITERKKAEEAIKKSLAEKELLLKEVHHRVKNNLQIIISLLKLQSKYVHDSRDKDMFEKSRARVETMSLIHEKLYKSSDISNIKFGQYIKELSGQIIKAYGQSHQNVKLNIQTDDLTLSIDSAIPCGLIINELVANSLKYGFPNNEAGEINIEVFKREDNIIITVKDNGIGLPQNFEITQSDSMGLQLVNTLVRQLDGEIWIDSSSGTKYTIVCKETKYRERL